VLLLLLTLLHISALPHSGFSYILDCSSDLWQEEKRSKKMSRGKRMKRMKRSKKSRRRKRRRRMERR
jgi:hypothetical protein